MSTQTKLPPVLIAGAGYVGGTLASQLAQGGTKVYALSRSGVPAEGSSDRPIVLQADCGKPETLRSLPSDIELAVYAVAAGLHTDEGYLDAYVRGMENIIAALREQAPRMRRLIFTSSTSVYGQNDGGWVDELSETSSEGFTRQRMLEAESRCLESGFEPVVVRFSGIYGPTRHRTIEEVRSGKAVCLTGAPRYTNRIHRDDCAGVLEYLLTREAPQSIYIGTDCDPSDRNDLLRWIAATLGCPPPEERDGVAEEVRRFGTNKRLSNRRLLDSGYQFKFPTYREGYAHIIETEGLAR